MIKRIFVYDTEDNTNGELVYAVVKELDKGVKTFDKRDDLRNYFLGLGNNKEKILIFAHNAAYDLMNVFKLNDVNITMNAGRFIFAKLKSSSVYFYDTLNYFVNSIEELAKYTPFKKLDLSDLKGRCLNDVLICEYYVKLILDMHKKNNFKSIKKTASSFAFTLLLKNFKDDYFITRNFFCNEISNSAFYGAKVEAYKIGNFADKKLYYYDINSMYAYIIKEIDLPDWHCCVSTKNCNLKNFEYEGYSLINFDSDNEKPFFPISDKFGKIFFLNGKNIIGFYTHREIRYALQNNLIKLNAVYYQYYSKKKIIKPFKKFVEKYYKLRLEAKKANNEVLSMFYKLILNSCYGKFSTKSDRNILKELESEKTLQDGITIHEQDGKIYYYQKLKSYFKFKNLIIASYITAGARILLDYYIRKLDSYYSDTDSIISEKNITDENFVNEQIGRLKKEEIKNLCIAGAKIYCYDTLNGEFKSSLKGVKKSEHKEFFNNLFEKYFKTDLFGNLEVDKKIDVSYKKPVKIREALRLNKRINVWEEVKKSIDLDYQKRKIKLDNVNDKCYDTQAHYAENIISKKVVDNIFLMNILKKIKIKLSDYKLYNDNTNLDLTVMEK